MRGVGKGEEGKKGRGKEVKREKREKKGKEGRKKRGRGEERRKRGRGGKLRGKERGVRGEGRGRGCMLARRQQCVWTDSSSFTCQSPKSWKRGDKTLEFVFLFHLTPPPPLLNVDS